VAAAKKPKPWEHSYPSGNMGRHHKGLIHPGYYDLPLRRAFYARFQAAAEVSHEGKAAA